MKSILGREDRHYRKIGIEKETQIWEDGLRTRGGKGAFEWWYFDFEYPDGTKVVAVYSLFNKRDFKGITGPTASVEITFPGKATIESEFTEGKGATIRASREKCDVKIGDSYIKYIDGNYEIYFKSADVEFKTIMNPMLPMWRPGTGYWFLGDDEALYTAWFVAVPRAKVSCTIKIGNDTKELKEGTGYHDHNWGNVPMPDVIHHWYWGRAIFPDYTIIASHIVAEKKYGYSSAPVIMIGKGNKIIADDERKTSVERLNTVVHPITHKLFSNIVRFTHKSDSGEIYTVEFTRSRDIAVGFLLDMLGVSFFKKIIAKMLGINPTYVRCIGDVNLSIKKDGKEENLKVESIWEQMYFGKAVKSLSPKQYAETIRE